MKGRGNYTWTYSKRPYQVKFDSDISMLGMKPSKTWLFITNYTDGSLSRSAVFYKLAQELGIDYAIEFETADVYINGNYNGTYLVTSKVERGTNRVDITKNDSLIEMDNYVDTYQVVSSISNHKFTIKYPDLEDATEEETNQKLQLNKELIDNLENKIYDQNVTYEELSQIIDLESFAKAYWVFEISENYDAMYGSTYIYTKDNLVHMGPMWDFDNTLNMISKNNTSLTDYYLLGSKGGAGNRRVRWFNELMKRQEFSDLIDKTFLDNIQTFENLATSTDDYVKKINKSALMNYSRWPYDVMKSEHSYYMGGDSFEEASTNLISSINTRVDFYLNEYKSLRIKELKYETKDVNNNKITGTINLDSSGAILLPNTISSNAEIVLSGSTDAADNVEFTTISLSDGIYQDKLYLSNNVSVVCDKKVNRSSYNLFFEKEETNIIELQVATSPTKTEYYEGQVFDKTGMIINALYTDNTSKKITTYSVSSEPLTINDTSVTVTYQNFTVSVPITVKVNSLVDIKIETEPDKLKYKEGEKFNPEGMIIMATYEDGSKKEVKDYTYSKNALSLSDKKVIISYQTFTVEVNIEVGESPLKEVVIKTNPTKLKYTEGEIFNPSGMIVIAVMENGKEVEINDYTYPTKALTTNNKVIYIEYNGKKAPLTLTIIKKKLTQANITPNNNKKEEITDSKIVTGENQTLTLKDDTTLDIEVNEKPDSLEKVSINGNPLSRTDYSVYGETLMIRIHNDYLKSLENENTIDITLKNGKILSTKFFINKEKEDESQHNTSTDVDDITDSIDDDKEFVEEKENKFNLKWLYGLIIIPVIFVIVLFKRRKKEN